MKRKIKISIAVLSLAMLGTAGFIGIPKWIGKRISHHESGIIAFLKNLSSAQYQIQASGAIDTDRDGAGEYGFIGEMSGARALRGSKEAIEVPVLDRSKLVLVGQGIYRISGYYLRLYLPDKNGEPTLERDPEDASHASKVDASLSARVWWAIAWPVWYGVTGNRCFFLSQTGDVLASNNQPARYSGMGRIPPPNAATPPAEPPNPPWIPAVNDFGAARVRWTVV